MKLSNSLFLLGLSLSASLAVADVTSITDGANGSGGGAQLATAFHLRAQELIRQISLETTADTLCSADLLNEALGSTKIRIVDQLVDPQTGKPVEDQNLDAYTSPGDMQLLKTKWGRYLNEARPSWMMSDGARKSVDVLILHEVYRATRGKCDDEGYKISDKIPFYLARPNKLSKILKFTTALPSATVSELLDYRLQLLVICEGEVTAKPSSQYCVVLRGRSQEDQYKYLAVASLSVDRCEKGKLCSNVPGRGFDFGVKTLFQSFSLSETGLNRLEALLSLTSPQRPLYVVVDMNGVMLVGVDVDHLNPYSN